MTETPPRNSPSPNLVFVTVAALVCFVISCAIALFILVPDGKGDTAASVLLGMVPGILLSLYAAGKIDSVKQDTYALRNGEGAAKIQRNVHAALDEREQRQSA